MEIARVHTKRKPTESISEVELHGTYTLRSRGAPQDGAAFVDPRQGEISHVSCSVGPVQRLTGKNDGIWYVRRADGATFDEAKLELRAVFPARSSTATHAYRVLTPAEKLAEIEARNIGKYGNPLGPNFAAMLAKYDTWGEMIEASLRPGGKDLFPK